MNMADKSFPLHEACESGKLVRVRTCIQNGYNMNEQDSLGQTPLMLAVSGGHLKIVKELVRADADLEIRNLNGRTALHLACYYGYQKVMKLLIESVSNINEQDKNGKTALMLAVEEGHCFVVGVLMQAGADTAVKDKKGKTAICLAASYALVRHLVTDVEELSREQQNHVLWYACVGGDLSMVKSVIRAGCDVDHFHRGHTPLMMASIGGHDDVVKELILAGCKVDLWSEWCFVGWFGFITKMVRAWPALVVWAVLTALLLMVPNVWVQIVCYWILTIAVAYFNEPFKILRMKTWIKVVAIVGILIEAILVWAEVGTSAQADLIAVAVAVTGTVAWIWTRMGEELLATVLIKVVIVTMALAMTVAGVGALVGTVAGAMAVTVVVAVAGAGTGIAAWFWTWSETESLVILNKALPIIMTISVTLGMAVELATAETVTVAAVVAGAAAGAVATAAAAAATGAGAGAGTLPIAVVGIVTNAIQVTDKMGLVYLRPILLVNIIIGMPLIGTIMEMRTLSGTGMTALHYAAWYDHIKCGTYLVEAGANVRAENKYLRTPLHIYLHQFRAAVQQVSSSLLPKRVIVVIGNSEHGKSTLVKALQSESRTHLQSFFYKFVQVDDIKQRTAGIEAVPFSSTKYGKVLFYDFAGQSDYHGPHQPFLKAMLNKLGVPLSLLLLVKATEEQDVIKQQLIRWLQPIALASSPSTPEVILVGSFLDKVKSKKMAQQKLKGCIDLVQKEFPSLKVPKYFLLDCREPESAGIKGLRSYLQQTQSTRSTSTALPYNIDWVVAQLQKSFSEQSIQLTTFRVWLQDNAQNLPTNLPPPEEVCQVLSAAGCILFLHNKQDPSQSWLILDLQTILHDVYGTLFSPDQDRVNQFGLLHCTHLSELFPKLDPKMIQEVLITLEFCIRVDPLLLQEEIFSLTDKDEVGGWLYFPALVSAEAPEVFTPDPQCLHWACWQLKTDDKHIILAHLLQGIILGIAATHVFIEKDLPPSVRKHCCNVWRNGISWRSTTGVDVAVQISDCSVVQVIGRSREGPGKLYLYISSVTQCIFGTIVKLSPAIKATPYIIHPYTPISLDEAEPYPPATRYPVASIVRSIEAGNEYVYSLPIASGSGSVNYSIVSLQELFGGWQPTLHVALCLKEIQNKSQFTSSLEYFSEYPPESRPKVSSQQARSGSYPLERGYMHTRHSESIGHETVLRDRCWVPFGVQTVQITAKGGILYLQPLSSELAKEADAIFVDVPPYSVNTYDNVEIHYAVMLDGPFALPEGYQFGSLVVYIYYDGQRVTQPLTLHLPNWYGGNNNVKDGLSFAIAPHSLEGKTYQFELLGGGKFSDSSNYGELVISGHCSLFAEVLKEGATLNYQAICLEKEEDTQPECVVTNDIAVTYASPLWPQILQEHRFGWKVERSASFQFKSDRITATLKIKRSNGWQAAIRGPSELLSNQVQYNCIRITSDERLEMAVKNCSYPPTIKFVVMYNKELRRTGQCTWVELHISGMDPEMEFQCRAYEQAQVTPPTPPLGLTAAEPTSEANMSPLAGIPPTPVGTTRTTQTGIASSLPMCSPHTETTSSQQVLNRFEEQFINEMDVNAVVFDLLHEDIITEGDKDTIMGSKERRLQNQHLHFVLRNKCTDEAFKTVCDKIIAVKGNPKMKALGEAMKRMLETGN